jgi:sugar-specific transcriptional regulator TrmB
MRDNEKNIKTLAMLGVSVTQAKIYLALIEKGTSTIRVVSNQSGIGRPDTYRAMLELKEIGLVETVLATPTMYRPLPLSEGVSCLLDSKQKEFRLMKEKAGKLLIDYERKTQCIETICDSEFVLVPKGTAIIKKVNNSIVNAKHNIDCITSFKRFNQMILAAGDEIIEAARRGVEVRFIIERNNDTPLLKNFTKFTKKASFQFRYLPKHQLLFALTLFDKKEAQVVTSFGCDFTHSPILRSNNKVFVKIIQEYYENLWFTQSKPWEGAEQETIQPTNENMRLSSYHQTHAS